MHRVGLTQFDQPHTHYKQTHTCQKNICVYDSKEYEAREREREKTIRAIIESIFQSVNQT